MRRERFAKLLVGMCEFMINKFDLQYLFYVPSISKTKQHAPATVPPLDLVASVHLCLLQDQEHEMLPGEGVRDAVVSGFSLSPLSYLTVPVRTRTCPSFSVMTTFSDVKISVGTLSNGYTKSGPLPRVAPFRSPIAKLTRALAAHFLSTITNAPYLGMVFGEHIT